MLRTNRVGCLVSVYVLLLFIAIASGGASGNDVGVKQDRTPQWPRITDSQPWDPMSVSLMDSADLGDGIEVTALNGVPYEDIITTYRQYSCDPEDWIQLFPYECPDPPGKCLYVGNSVCATGDGSYANPFCSIQEAVDLANPNDHVVVQDGLYKGFKTCGGDFGELCDEHEDCPPSIYCSDSSERRNVHVVIDKTIVLRSENGPENCIVDIEDDGSAFTVGDGAPVIQGFTIRRSNGKAAIRLQADAGATDSVTIRGNIFEENQYSAIYSNANADYPVMIVGNVFQDNASIEHGGAIRLSAHGQIQENCIVENTAEDGGGGIAVVGFDFSAEITDNYIAGNKAETDGTGSGGGIYIERDPPTAPGLTVTISGNTLIANTAQTGGGIYGYGTNPTIERCVIQQNRAEQNDGGGIALDGLPLNHTVTISHCTLWGNRAQHFGGGMYLSALYRTVDPALADVNNCLFVGNLAQSPNEGGGGGLYIGPDVDATVTNCTFADNCANYHGGGIYKQDPYFARIYNSILWSNWAWNDPEYHGWTCTFANSIVEGGASGDCVVANDPLFMAPLEPCPATALGNYRLSAGSWAIDYGDNSQVVGEDPTDLDGGPRMLDDPMTANDKCFPEPFPDPVDLGAYEYRECDDDADCDDEVSCTVDSCNELTATCEHVPVDALCDNTVFCDGVETCDSVLDCQPGTPEDCNDNVGCTIDSCNEVTDECDNIPDDGNCPDDGLFCNGDEYCDVVDDCSSTGDPCLPDEFCNEAMDRCDECEVDEDCDDDDPCNGIETCAPDGTCVPGEITDCNENGIEDYCDIESGTSEDCSLLSHDCCEGNGQWGCSDGGIAMCVCNYGGHRECCRSVPGWTEECVQWVEELGCGSCEGADGNGIPDECEPDCNENSVADSCDIAEGTSDDCSPAHNCCDMHYPELGCSDPDIEACVCAVDASCCNEWWTYSCVLLVDQLGCGTCDSGNGIPDECESVAIISSDPPSGAIDARQPSTIDGTTLFGWDSIDVTFDGDACIVSAADFMINVVGEGAGGGTPEIANLITNGDTVTLELDRRIPPGAWTQFVHTPSGTSVCLGYLPADVDGDRTSGPVDILKLTDHLDGLITLPDWSVDIDRDGWAGPADIVRLIDLLLGAGEIDSWLNKAIELESPCGEIPLTGACAQCEPPVVEAVGCRYLEVSFASTGPYPCALLVTSPDWPCVSKYVDAEGLLGDGPPVFQTPEQWGTVYVHGPEIVPDSEYEVRFHFSGVSVLSAASSATTWMWADVNHDDEVNITDVMLIIAGYQGDFSQASLEALDIMPCTPDGVINVTDLIACQSAYQGAPYDNFCPLPCP